MAVQPSKNHNGTENILNKSKRGVVEQTQIYGEQPVYKTIGVYAEPSVAATAYSNTSPKPSSYVKPVYEPSTDAVKVNAQIIYGYPTQDQAIVGATNNQQVHYSQPLPVAQILYAPLPNSSPVNLYHHQAETAITPVQHHTTIHHPQQQHPPAPYVLPKYVYQNPKILYHPNTQQPIVQNQYAQYQQQQQQHNPQYQQQNQHQVYPQTQPFHYQTLQYQKPVLPVVNSYKPVPKLLSPPSPIFPNAYSYQQFHARQPWKPVPEPAPVKTNSNSNSNSKNLRNNKNDDDEAEDHEKQVSKDDEEEVNSEEHYEEDDEEKPYRSSRYRYDDDDESHERFEEEDEDEDSHRGSSKYYRSKPNKHHTKPYKYQSNDNYRFRESYKAKSKNGKPTKSYYKSYDDREPKKGQRYTKTGGYKPKSESFEGKYSENVPVVHNKQVFQEKWFVTKSHDMKQ